VDGAVEARAAEGRPAAARAEQFAAGGASQFQGDDRAEVRLEGEDAVLGEDVILDHGRDRDRGWNRGSVRAAELVGKVVQG
jgi:hypothetical protein